MYKEYKLLEGSDLIDYVIYKNYLKGNKEDFQVEEVSDGNINHVHLIKNNLTEESICIKQGDVLLRSSGRPLSQDRTRIEANALIRYGRLVGYKSPRIYDYDEIMNIIIMEDISSYENMRVSLMNKKKYPFFVEDIIDFILKTSMPTTSLYMDAEEKKLMIAEYINPELCKISEDLVFTEPFVDYKARNVITPGLEEFVDKEIYRDSKLKYEASKLKENFMEKSQALIHGDLHMGSIFINQDGLKVLDPEFAFFGPLGYDTGNILGNLFFSLVYSEYYLKDIDYSNYLKNTIIDFINKLVNSLKEYLDTNSPVDEIFKSKEYRDYFLEGVIRDTIGYGGTEILRRTIGDSKVLELESIKDLKIRKLLDRKLILLSKKMILRRANIRNGNDIINLYESL